MISFELIQENRRRAKEMRMKHTDKRRDQGRNSQLKLAYGISLADFREMLRIRNNKCDICGSEVFEKGGRGQSSLANVDHCHESGKIRGILCGKCNRAIGLLGDTTCSIQKALEYLQNGAVREI